MTCAICLISYLEFVTKKNTINYRFSRKIQFSKIIINLRIKNDAKTKKRPIYVICHLSFFNQVPMAYCLHYGRFYGP